MLYQLGESRRALDFKRAGTEVEQKLNADCAVENWASPAD